jgi:transaldolase
MIAMTQTTNTTAPLKALSDAGVAIWLDDLSRDRITSGNLAELISDSHLVGVTSNPTIFAHALSQGHAYDQQLSELAAAGKTTAEAVRAITTTDVRDACDVFADVYSQTGGRDGRISLEVDPRKAMDTDATINEAKQLWQTVNRPNLFIKIPATAPGLPAITAAIGAGISVNVTLIFGIERYRAVMDAYFAGLEQARQTGHDLSSIQSVASFFVSRVDTEYDKRLDQIGTPEAKSVRSQAAIANARLAYAAYQEAFNSQRWQQLKSQGANSQRPLWASTGVKDPSLPDTLYVTELVVDNTVNTMPEKTLNAVADHAEISGDQVTGRASEAEQVMNQLDGLGISYDDVVRVLESEGVEKFDTSWRALEETVESGLKSAASA